MLVAAILFVALFELVTVFTPITLVGKRRNVLTPDIAACAVAILVSLACAMTYVTVQLHSGPALYVDVWILSGAFTQIIILTASVGRVPGGDMTPGRAAFNVGRSIVELAAVLYLLTLAV